MAGAAIGARTMPACCRWCATRRHEVLAPRRGDDLHADRHLLGWQPQTGTAQTGRPMHEIGCVSRPRLGRAGRRSAVDRQSTRCRSAARRTASPARSARRRREQLGRRAARTQRRTRCACTTHAAGSSAPARKRSRDSGSNSAARVRRSGRCSAPPSASVMRKAAARARLDIGPARRSARAERLRDARRPRRAPRVRRVVRTSRRARAMRRPSMRVAERRRRPARSARCAHAGSRAVGALHRVVGEREVVAPSARTGPSDPGSRRTDSCRARDSRP